MHYYRVVNGIHPNNTYLVYNDRNDCIIIDPSLGEKEIDKMITNCNFNVVGILLTHAHYDHIFSVDYFVDKYDVDVYCSKNCSEFIKDSTKNLSKTSNNAPYEMIVKAKPIIVNDDFKINDFEIKIMRTYGHSQTCLTYFIDEFAFTGDFLFKNTIGRCNLYSSSQISMNESLRNFAKLETNYQILPGHGETTTLKEELEHNPYLVQYGDFYE